MTNPRRQRALCLAHMKQASKHRRIFAPDRGREWWGQFGMAFMFAAGMIFVISWVGG